jgi:uncharacterized protein YndB with AHSA1/START domain
MKTCAPIACVVLVLCVPAAAGGDVVDVSPAGFTLKSAIEVPVPPSRVFDTLVGVAGWWDGEHTYSGDAKNLAIDPRAGGCFCERLADGGSISHMTVLYAAPAKTLRLTGGLGPLQELAVSGVMTWTLAATPGGTKIEMTYAVGGYAPGVGRLQQLAPLVNSVLDAQVQRLKAALTPAPPSQ